jgi:ABC-type amino acid transport substrate-binding protein
MRHAPLLLLLLAAGADACTLRIGYTSQNAPPYYLGTDTVPKAPGATVDLLREMAAASGCAVELVRLPTARLLLTLNAGEIDAVALTTPPAELPQVVYPVDGRGKPDASRGVPQFIMVYVRAADRAAGDRDAGAFLRGRRVGVTHGVSYAAELRQAGMRIDDGAANSRRNFDKLKLDRVDAVAVSLNAPGDLDALLAKEYGGKLARLERPFRTRSLWLMVNKTYYGAHRAEIDAMWDWLGQTGAKRLPALLKKYQAPRPHEGR